MTVETWTELLTKVGPAHHEAFLATDGEDPDWPTWYAAWLLERLPGQSPAIEEPELVRLLEEAAQAHKASDGSEAWPPFYARFLTERLDS
jgi:hypothetical protein